MKVTSSQYNITELHMKNNISYHASRFNHLRKNAKTGWLGIRIIYASGATCLPADCCCGELVFVLDILLLKNCWVVVHRCLSLCTSFFGHCVVCSSSIYRFWLPPFGISSSSLEFYFRLYRQSYKQKCEVNKGKSVKLSSLSIIFPSYIMAANWERKAFKSIFESQVI
jgi:hypothetical protein